MKEGPSQHLTSSRGELGEPGSLAKDGVCRTAHHKVKGEGQFMNSSRKRQSHAQCEGLSQHKNKLSGHTGYGWGTSLWGTLAVGDGTPLRPVAAERRRLGVTLWQSDAGGVAEVLLVDSIVMIVAFICSD